MTAQVAADLRAAADVLRRDGWTQGEFHRLADGSRICHCAEGAIGVATGAHADVEPEADFRSGVTWRVGNDAAILRRDVAVEALEEHIEADGLSGIPGWNDDETRTADEVIAALEAAADAAEAKA